MSSLLQSGLVSSLLDLVLPRECGGCEAVGTLWCTRCDTEVHGQPVALRPRVDPGVPCWALGTYSGPRRGAVLALKERGRRDLVAPLGCAIAGALTRLRYLGHIDPPELGHLVLIPAPTRARAARSRGGDPVGRFTAAAALRLAPEFVSVSLVLRMRSGVRDSVGLGAAERAANVAGRIEFVRSAVSRPAEDACGGKLPRDRTVVLVDDVLTTGATANESVCVLKESGIEVSCVLVVAAV